MHEKTGIRDSLYIILPIYFTLYVKTYTKIKNRRKMNFTISKYI